MQTPTRGVSSLMLLLLEIVHKYMYMRITVESESVISSNSLWCIEENKKIQGQFQRVK